MTGFVNTCAACGDKWIARHDCPAASAVDHATKPLTQSESAELRDLMRKWRGGHWLHHEHPIYRAVCDGLPRVLGENDRLRAALREIAEKCTSSFCPVEDEIRAIVERAVGGDS